jgi:hypothetical protein
MKRIAVVSVLAVWIVGCSQNTLEIQNWSEYDVWLNFRAQSYEIPSGGGTRTVTDIPNGTFGYGTVYEENAHSAPDGVEPGEGLKGSMTFERSETEMLLIYGSTYTCDSAQHCTAEIWGALSSSQPTSLLTGP